jgi:hypothetical protein
MSRIRELSADEEARRLAFVREPALRDEVSLLNDARWGPALSYHVANSCSINRLLIH